MLQWHEDRRTGVELDTLYLLSHPPTITTTRRGPGLDELPPATATLDVVKSDRGGLASFHGPGQIVGYVIASVGALGPVDFVAAVCNQVAEAVRRTGLDVRGHSELGLDADRGGVWTPNGKQKVASIGMRVSDRITRHGFALNVDIDLDGFSQILPCGLLPGVVTNLEQVASLQNQRAPSRDRIVSALTAAFSH
ncbi:lipoyl(octanoyl) transferase [Rhodococcus fascians]|uniref:lipoyl(octanoyl) transferase LipB n=1 Tax=Nocardiaceae TaxID=85025 RepID=UPI0028678AC6|nr:lipoyl(octanoyl) transferase [Rhodococcus sp. 3258]MDR6934533.1 lipoyl(octanoyl) transferase [Rhodococcus fascians]